MAQVAKGGQAPVAKGGWSSGGAGQEVKTSQRLPTRNSSGPIGHTPVKAAYLPRGPVRGAGPSKQSAASNPLYNPMAQLSGQSLKQAASNIANVQVQGPINDQRALVAQNNKASATEQKTDFGYYMQLAQAAKDAVSAQQSQGAALQSQLQGIGSSTQGQLAQLGQQAGSGALARMQALGLDAGQTQLLAADTAHQQGNSSLQSQLGQTAGALQTANYTGEGNAITGATGLQGQEQIGNLARATSLANQPLNQKIADLQANRGALTATALGQLRTQERNYQIAQEGLAATTTTNQQKLALQQAQDKAANALKAAGIQVTNSNNVANQKIRQQANSIAATKLSIDQQNNLANQATRAGQLAERTRNDNLANAYRLAALNAKRAAAGQPVKLVTGASAARLMGQITQAEALIQSAQAQKKAGTWKGSPNIRNDLEAHYHFPDAFVEAAYELLGYGSIRPPTATILRNSYGLNVTGGTFKGAPIRVKPQPGAQPILKAIGNLL